MLCVVSEFLMVPTSYFDGDWDTRWGTPVRNRRWVGTGSSIRTSGKPHGVGELEQTSCEPILANLRMRFSPPFRQCWEGTLLFRSLGLWELGPGRPVQILTIRKAFFLPLFRPKVSFLLWQAQPVGSPTGLRALPGRAALGARQDPSLRSECQSPVWPRQA